VSDVALPLVKLTVTTFNDPEAHEETCARLLNETHSQFVWLSSSDRLFEPFLLPPLTAPPPRGPSKAVPTVTFFPFTLPESHRERLANILRACEVPVTYLMVDLNFESL
jgi:hypothetical protein